MNRRAFQFLMGMGLLLFASYAITLRGYLLQASRRMVFLGERTLSPASPAAFRLIGWNQQKAVPLAISWAELSIDRLPFGKTVLARRHPQLDVVDFNVRIPPWPPGPAKLTLSLETEQGPMNLEADVQLEGERESRLRLVSPLREMEKPPVLLQLGSGWLHPEASPAHEPGEPAHLWFFPRGGRLSPQFSTRMLVLAADWQGQPIQGELQLNEPTRTQVDPSGFALVEMKESIPQALKLSFQNAQGRLDGEVTLARSNSPVDAVSDQFLVAAGEKVFLELRSVGGHQQLYLDAWWRGGWCSTVRVQLVTGLGWVTMEIPAGILGPLVIRASVDPIGQDNQDRYLGMIVGQTEPPTIQEGFAFLRNISSERSFWKDLPDMEKTISILGLQALVSRVVPPQGPLPLLIDSAGIEAEALQARRRDLVNFGIGSAAVVSVVVWLVTGFYRIRSRARQEGGYRNSLRKKIFTVWIAAGLVLAAGWGWLYWFTR